MACKEDEAESKKTRMKESTKKKPVQEDEDGKLIKEDEEEEESEEDKKKRKKAKKESEDESEDEAEKEAEDEDEDEDAKKEAEDEDDFGDDDDDDDKKKKKARKGEMGGENPSESATAATSEQHTMTSRPVINTAQNVYTPSSSVSVGRNATGNTPETTHYSGKSANLELQKSPLFMELSKQMAALEKSVMDRLNNIQKMTAKVEKFYQQPFYKAIDENASPEGVQKMSVKEQIEKGNVRFTD